MIRASTFKTGVQRELAIAVFLDRGYRLRPSAAELWPGELRPIGRVGIEWRPKDDDPAAPLWELLQQLHVRGSAERIGLALELLVDQAVSPREVVAALRSSVSVLEATCPS